MKVLLTIAEGKILNYCYSNLYYTCLIFFLSVYGTTIKNFFFTKTMKKNNSKIQFLNARKKSEGNFSISFVNYYSAPT